MKKKKTFFKFPLKRLQLGRSWRFCCECFLSFLLSKGRFKKTSRSGYLIRWCGVFPYVYWFFSSFLFEKHLSCLALYSASATFSVLLFCILVCTYFYRLRPFLFSTLATFLFLLFFLTLCFCFSHQLSEVEGGVKKKTWGVSVFPLVFTPRKTTN